MATKPKIPNAGVPLVGPDGRMTQEWYRYFAAQHHVGNFATTATGGAGTLPANPVGFITIFVDGTERKQPFYNV